MFYDMWCWHRSGLRLLAFRTPPRGYFFAFICVRVLIYTSPASLFIPARSWAPSALCFHLRVDINAFLAILALHRISSACLLPETLCFLSRWRDLGFCCFTLAHVWCSLVAYPSTVVGSQCSLLSSASACWYIRLLLCLARQGEARSRTRLCTGFQAHVFHQKH